MPRICEFFGIFIYMYFEDHAPPHFHAIYGEHEAVIGIEDMRVVRGLLPSRAYGLVAEWAILHRTELIENWNAAVACKPLQKIEPLQ